MNAFNHLLAQALRRAVYQVALYFKREFRYDLVQYGVDGHETDEQSRAFLWLDMDRPAYRGSTRVFAVIGACCFRLREWTDAPPDWVLQWVWFHPYARRRGLLRKSWEHFRERFGDFFPEPPLGRAMDAFIDSLPEGQQPGLFKQLAEAAAEYRRTEEARAAQPPAHD